MNKKNLKMLQRSIDNIHFQAIQKRVNMEDEIRYSKEHIGSPIINKQSYLAELGANFLKAKQQIRYLL